MRIDNFKIEDWMNAYCPQAKYDLTTTCIKPLSLKELVHLCELKPPYSIFDKPLDYGEVFGSKRLKNAILSLYTNIFEDNITVTHGAVGANQLVFESLLEKGDEVLVLAPIYQQHYSIPKALGAKVNISLLKEEANWLPNLKEIEAKLTPKTKLICINNPNNPTGSLIPNNKILEIVNIAKNNNSWILCDEAYRGLNFKGNNYSTSISDVYEKGISTGSMSKTYSLPGLRVGWVAARKDLINEINKHREYNTISISILDDYFSSIALENKEKILRRNFSIMKEGYNILSNWLNEEIYIKTNLPQAGTTALLRYKKDIPSRILCQKLLKETGVLLLPGETMEIEGTVRLGFCCEKEILSTGLKLFSKFLRKV